MKQLVFTIACTLVGTFGALYVEPFLGIAVYYLFAALRPQSMWHWVLPPDVRWSYYVAIATILAVVLARLGPKRQILSTDKAPEPPPRLTRSHLWVLLFGAWIVVSYFNAFNMNVAYRTTEEYGKIFVMFLCAALYVRNTRQIWWLFLLATLSLGYIGYEMNFRYLFQGRLDIYHNGYGGMDNNGAATMLAMGVPLCIFLWEAIRRRWRWLFAALVPILLHAVLMSYSRGAMVALVVAVPFIIMRSRRKKQVILAIVVLCAMLPVLAGEEIQARFFSIQQHEVDGAANSRKESWAAAYRIASDYPVFGVGPRNANLFSLQYGADQYGRTIHSQYLQIAADNGFVGLGLYLGAIVAFMLSMRRTRRTLKTRDDERSRVQRSLASGIECSMIVFLVGAIFLSLELFELPYLLMLMGMQLTHLVHRPAPDRSEPASAPAEPSQAVSTA